MLSDRFVSSGRVRMSMQTSKGLAYDPQDFERLLVSRQNAGDVDGMAALYEGSEFK